MSFSRLRCYGTNCQWPTASMAPNTSLQWHSVRKTISPAVQPVYRRGQIQGRRPARRAAPITERALSMRSSATYRKTLPVTASFPVGRHSQWLSNLSTWRRLLLQGGGENRCVSYFSDNYSSLTF